MEKTKVLILTGNVSQMHDYRTVNDLLRTLLEATGRFRVDLCEEPRGLNAEGLRPYRLVLVNYDGMENVFTADPNGPGAKVAYPERTTPLCAQTAAALAAFCAAGGGLLFYHSSCCVSGEGWPEDYQALIGATHSFGKYRGYRELGYSVLTQPGHPITQGVAPEWEIVDDDFLNGVELLDGSTLLAAIHDPVNGRDVPVMWAHPWGKGRVFAVSLGHQAETIRRLDFVRLFTRGADWAANGEITVPLPDRDSCNNWMKGWPWYYCDGCGRGLGI